ncbi:uncharacterized protein LOC134683592 [Mytilus trossulus]|uniref:uncharacterized protein LOC134683592 n=1 Tax=Mytilus trossulus TaxID=6551 RepID=UPI003003DCDF
MGNQLLIFVGFLIQLGVTIADEECPYKGLNRLNAVKGKRYAVVNPDIPGAYNFKPKLPVKVYGNTGWQDINYSIGNGTKCVFTYVVKVLRCEQEVSSISDYEGGTNCSVLMWGRSCNAACSDGKVSVGGPAVFTCEIDNSNRTFLQLDKATVCQSMFISLQNKYPGKDLIFLLDTWKKVLGSRLAPGEDRFSCNLKGSVKIKWPTIDFTLVFRVLESFRFQQHTDLTGNGTILFSMTECSNCALSNLTGLDLKESEIPSFKFYPFLPCRMDGCLEDSLHMFKARTKYLGPNG